jgi:iron complex outermembrane recepter protein
MLVGGIRAEQTNVRGEGRLLDPTLNFQRRPDGSFILGANGRPLPIAPAGLPTSMLTYVDRGLEARKEYLRWFPSLNASFNVRENLIARAGYYWSVGRPDFNQYAGTLTLPDTELPPSSSNRITVNNAGIKAWQARTLKTTVEYYFERVGLLSVGVFRRDFTNLFATTTFNATPDFLSLYSLDPDDYGRFEVGTQHNLRHQVRMTGVDFNYKQALTFLPSWARGVQVFANGSAQRAIGDETNALANYIPRSGSWGISLSRPAYNLRVNWNYRGKHRRAPVAAGRSIEPNTYNWGSKRLYIDVHGEYYFYRRLSLFAHLRNVGNATEDFEVHNPYTPDHAQFRSREDFGALWTFGIKGTF